MAGVNTTIKSGDRAATGSPAQIPCLIGCCSDGTVGTIYQFDPGDDVAGDLGGGPLADAVYHIHSTTGSRVVVSPATPTWSTAPSVTHSGTGPTVTCALTAGASGCYDDHTIVVTVKLGGILGSSQIGIAYDGSTEVDTIPTPTENAPHLVGTVDLATLTLSTLATKTLVLSAPAALTVTFTTPTSVDDIATQFNTAADGAGVLAHAQIRQNSSGNEYLDLYASTGGNGVTITIDDATSTGEALLGFSTADSNLTATGTAATLALPYTGITLTFPSGTYVKDDTYTMVCTGPRASISAISTAATAAHDAYVSKPFGFIAVVQPSNNATNCAALQSSLSTTIAGWQAATSSQLSVYAVIGGPFHVASSTLATNDSYILVSDNALVTAFSGSSAALDSVAHDDVYLEGSAALRSGKFRRTAAVAWAAKRAAASKIAADVADGILVSGSLLGPDGLTRARDESRASTKLGGGAGPGFSVLTSTSAGLGSPKFAPGATRAGSSSRLRYSGVVAVAKEIARLSFGVVEGWVGETIPSDPSTGAILDGEKSSREGAIRRVLEPTLFTDDGGPLNVSSLSVSIDNSGQFIDDGIVPTTISFVPLGEIEEVDIDITAVGTTIANA